VTEETKDDDLVALGHGRQRTVLLTNPQIVRGPAGPPGARGVQGEPGLPADEESILLALFKHIKSDPSFRGSDGLPGEPGPQGVSGPAGPIGPAGGTAEIESLVAQLEGIKQRLRNLEHYDYEIHLVDEHDQPTYKRNGQANVVTTGLHRPGYLRQLPPSNSTGTQ